MNATELHLKDGRTAGIFFCEKCRCVAATQFAAEDCCKPYKCKTCGKEVERYHTMCPECVASAEAIREHQRFEKAEKITEDKYGDWVYCEGIGDGFFMDTSSLRDAAECDGSDLPAYVYACKPIRFVHVCAESILEGIGEGEAYEDFDYETLIGIPEFKAAVEAFNQANIGHVSYEPDYTKAIILK